jgi:DNA (cytosine-5)-methyltransferase 1
MRVLDLFAGIGGFTVGLEKAGFETAAFCEIDPYAQKVLKKNWPEVPIYDDVRTITADRLAADGIRVDVITGGFPCQDISVAGAGVGLDGERSGLWSECARLLGDIQPRYAIFENVPNLLNGERGDWFRRVLWDISSVGYDAEWHCIPASAVGAHHRRDRIWIVAYPSRTGVQTRSTYAMGDENRSQGDEGQFAGASQQTPVVAYPNGDDGRRGSGSQPPRRDARLESRGCNSRQSVSESNSILADTSCQRIQGSWSSEQQEPPAHVREAILVRGCTRQRAENWEAEPAVGRVVDGFPGRSHRLKCLGNAVVPKIPEIIGRAILEAENDHDSV